MIDFSLSEEQRALRDLAHDFALNEIRPQAAHHDQTGEFPREIVRKAWGLLTVALAATRSALDGRAVDPGLHDLGGTEADDAARIDRRRLARFGIATHASAFLTDLEYTKSRKLDRLAALKRFDDRSQHRTV